MRWFFYLIISLAFQILAWIVTPILPLFASQQYGRINNNSGFGVEPRLPKYLSWFMTPDNSLWGDLNWKGRQDSTTYWAMVKWLYRNSIYGFKWTVLGEPMPSDSAWQWRHYSKTIRLDFGWLIDPYQTNPELYITQPKALFQFSIRKGK